jgi:hypothetical protein
MKLVAALFFMMRRYFVMPLLLLQVSTSLAQLDDFKVNKEKDFLPLKTKQSITKGHDKSHAIYPYCHDPVLLGSIISANSFSWNTGDTTMQISVSTAGTYIRTAKTGSVFVIDSFDVFDAYAIAAFTYSSSMLTYTFNNTSVNSDSCLWTFGDGDSSTLTNPIHTYAVSNGYTVCLIAYGIKPDCNDTICEYISPLGIKEEYNDVTVSIYPNPAKDELSVVISNGVFNDVSLEIQTLSGQRVKHQILDGKGSTSIRLDVSDLPPGFYLLKVMNNEMILTKSLIIE